MTSYEHIVSQKDVNRRIDQLLSNIHTNHSRNQIQLWIKKKFVTVNSLNVKANYRCQLNDKVQWSIPEERKLTLIPEDIPLSIIYEDEYLLIVNKPKGMVVHATADHQSGTLVHALLNYTTQLSKVGGEERPGIVHRLDKDTSGLLIVAKDDDIHTKLIEDFKHNKIERIYEAIVHGEINHENGLIDAPIGRDPNNRLKMAVIDGGREAITHFRVLERYPQFSRVQCQLETGRTHQIRVHMNYIGHSIVGDSTYSQGVFLDANGQVLYAKSLGFTHPVNNKWMSFEIEQPTYFKKLIKKINA